MSEVTSSSKLVRGNGIQILGLVEGRESHWSEVRSAVYTQSKHITQYIIRIILFPPSYTSCTAHLNFWLRLYATSRKVEGYIPDEVNEFLQFT
jgi:hypothetical protein